MAMEGRLIDGLTALHVAVLKDDREQVRALLQSREYGVDVRSSTGATPLMIASLYGRTKIFFYLVKKKASVQKCDYQNVAVLQYVKGPKVQQLLQEYQHIATRKPRRSGRYTIYYFLKHAIKTDQPRRALGAQFPDTLLSATPTSGLPPSTMFLRSRDGKHLELVGTQRIATTEVDIDLGRKSTGLLRGKNEAANTYRFAVSGWAGVKGNSVLDNKEYSGLVRSVCNMYGFKLEANWLDNRWRGDPTKKKGSYLSCHAEKQLGIWVLVESLSQALGTREVTQENISRLKEVSHQLPEQLRETQIELDHKPCSSCISFLNLLRQKAGLHIDWKPRQWFVEGQRSKLRRRDGHLQPNMGGSSKNSDDLLDELDENGEEDGDEGGDEDGDEDDFDNSSVTLEQEDDDDAAVSTTAPADPPVENSARNLRPQPRQLLCRHVSEPYRKGHSPINEPPQNKLPRWPEIDVRPRPPRPMGNLRTRFGYNTADSLSTETPECDVEKILDYNMDDDYYLVKRKDSLVPKWERAEGLVNAQEAIDSFKKATEDADLQPEDL